MRFGNLRRFLAVFRVVVHGAFAGVRIVSLQRDLGKSFVWIGMVCCRQFGVESVQRAGCLCVLDIFGVQACWWCAGMLLFWWYSVLVSLESEECDCSEACLVALCLGRVLSGFAQCGLFDMLCVVRVLEGCYKWVVVWFQFVVIDTGSFKPLLVSPRHTAVVVVVCLLILCLVGVWIRLL